MTHQVQYVSGLALCALGRFVTVLCSVVCNVLCSIVCNVLCAIMWCSITLPNVVYARVK